MTTVDKEGPCWQRPRQVVAADACFARLSYAHPGDAAWQTFSLHDL